MQFSQVPGQDQLKKYLISTVKNGRVAHAQLFLGHEGYGGLPLALAYAQYINCLEPGDTDSCGQCSNCIKSKQLIHPDIHYSYPVYPRKSGVPSISADWAEEWRKRITSQPFMTTFDWLQTIEADNKQGNISADECQEILKKFSLKPFEANYKILILWMPEYLGDQGNKLLKLLEEPPEGSVFLLVGVNADAILNTIISRTQLLKIPPLRDEEIATNLKLAYEQNDQNARLIAAMAGGDFIAALELLEESESGIETSFHQWLEMLLHTRKDRFVEFAENFARLGRENQKQWAKYGLQLIRNALLHQHHGQQHIFLNDTQKGLAEALAAKLDIKRIEKLILMLNKTIQYIERNANAKGVMLNISIQGSRLVA